MISYSDHAEVACPVCATEFDSIVYLVVDAWERPDLVNALRSGSLNLLRCPGCESTGPAGAPLLLHDPARARVLLLPSPDATEEWQWREQGQSLLFLLIGSLPEESRPAYLGAVEVVMNREELVAALNEQTEIPPVALAVEELLSAEDEDQIERLLIERPELLSDQAEQLLDEFATLLHHHGDEETADYAREVRALIQAVRTRLAE